MPVIENTAEKIIARLREQENEEGGLPLLLEFYRGLLEVQAKARKRIGVLSPTISGAGVQSRLDRGQPLAGFDELVIDWPLLRETFIRTIAMFGKYPQLFGELPKNLCVPDAGSFLTKKTMKAWYHNNVLPAAILNGGNANLVGMILQSAMQPLLSTHAGALKGQVKQEFWHRGYCPICGGVPDFAYLEKEAGARWLVCSRCDFEWQFPRLECPYCRTTDQASLSFFTDESEIYRLYLCDQCRCYLKTIDLRRTDADILLPLERIYTVDIDRQAVERGYSPGRFSNKKN